MVWLVNEIYYFIEFPDSLSHTPSWNQFFFLFLFLSCTRLLFPSILLLYSFNIIIIIISFALHHSHPYHTHTYICIYTTFHIFMVFYLKLYCSSTLLCLIDFCECVLCCIKWFYSLLLVQSMRIYIYIPYICLTCSTLLTRILEIAPNI